jgi:hypothetical protein
MTGCWTIPVSAFLVQCVMQDVKYFQIFNENDMENMNKSCEFLCISFAIYSLMHMQFPIHKAIQLPTLKPSTHYTVRLEPTTLSSLTAITNFSWSLHVLTFISTYQHTCHNVTLFIFVPELFEAIRYIGQSTKSNMHLPFQCVQISISPKITDFFSTFRSSSFLVQFLWFFQIWLPYINREHSKWSCSVLLKGVAIPFLPFPNLHRYNDSNKRQYLSSLVISDFIFKCIIL